MTLVVVDHPKDVDVYAGPDGRVRTVRRPAIPPLSAVDFDGVDFRAVVTSTDGDMWGSNPFNKDPELSANWTAGLVLRFPKPAGARKAKLVVRIGNTSWADAVFGRIFGLMGSSLQPWYQKVAADPAIREKTYRFMSEQGVALKAQVGVPGGGQDAGFFHPTGPFGIKDDVLEIEVPEAVDDTLTVRLRGGTFFWNVDSVAIDYSTDVPVHVRALTSLSAVDSAGNDVRQALMTADDDLLQHAGARPVRFRPLRRTPAHSRPRAVAPAGRWSAGWSAPTIMALGASRSGSLASSTAAGSSGP